MSQLNEFVNHQLAHNVIIVSIEGDLGVFAFDTLKEAYTDKVLFNPTADIIHQYWYDDIIIIRKLVSEAPRDQNCLWTTKIEKLLVDISSTSIPQITRKIVINSSGALFILHAKKSISRVARASFPKIV